MSFRLRSPFSAALPMLPLAPNHTLYHNAWSGVLLLTQLLVESHFRPLVLATLAAAGWQVRLTGFCNPFCNPYYLWANRHSRGHKIASFGSSFLLVCNSDRNFRLQKVGLLYLQNKDKDFLLVLIL